MADLTITAGNVRASDFAVRQRGIAGEAVSVGQAVYQDPADLRWKRADANVAACATAPLGVAVTSAAAAGQDLVVVTYDPDFTPGATLSLSAAGDRGVYVLSANAGGIAPVGDLASTMYPIVLGLARSSTKMLLRPVQGPTALTV